MHLDEHVLTQHENAQPTNRKQGDHIQGFAYVNEVYCNQPHTQLSY